MPVMKSCLASPDLYKFHGLLHYLLWVAAGAEESLEPPVVTMRLESRVKLRYRPGQSQGPRGCQVSWILAGTAGSVGSAEDSVDRKSHSRLGLAESLLPLNWDLVNGNFVPLIHDVCAVRCVLRLLNTTLESRTLF